MKLATLLILVAGFLGWAIAYSLVINRKRYSFGRVVVFSLGLSAVASGVMRVWPGSYLLAVLLVSYWVTLWLSHRRLLRSSGR